MARRLSAPSRTEPRRSRRSDGEETRNRVLEAALDCILEHGYYQASSNAIARQAGVTWGTIQHQFGTREVLLLEALKERWGHLHDALRDATVTGDTLEERLDSVFALLARWYGVPEFSALFQILLDLSSDPNTSASTREAALAHGREMTRAWYPLLAAAMGEAGKDRQLVEYAFLAMRGFLFSNQLTAKFASGDSTRRFRSLLVRGVAAVVEERAAERGLSTT
jgi:AcrR family transcriptional regulator